MLGWLRVCGLRGEQRLERVAGIEPASQAWKASALPLSYTRVPASGRPADCHGYGAAVNVQFRVAAIRPLVSGRFPARPNRSRKRWLSLRRERSAETNTGWSGERG